MGFPLSKNKKKEPQHLTFFEVTVLITSVAVKREHGLGKLHEGEFPLKQKVMREKSHSIYIKV